MANTRTPTAPPFPPPPQWYPEVNHFCKEVPIIVVGCKTDLRKDRSLVKKLRKKRLEPVTYHRVGTQPRRPKTRSVGQRRGHFRGSRGSGTANVWRRCLEYSGRFHLWKGEQAVCTPDSPNPPPHR